jgi:hypothetical protein
LALVFSFGGLVRNVARIKLGFGVKDAPRQLIGLKSNNFETFDPAKLTNALNERFSPEIHWESYPSLQRGLKIGIFYFAEAIQKPVVCTKNGGCLQQGAIYYRYQGRSEAIRYPELRRILDEEKARERHLWMKQLRKISEAGVDHVAILDLQSGEVSGANGKFYISDDLLPKLQFIREGQFVESEGALALRLIGDLQPTEGPVIQSTVQIPTPIREQQVIAAFLRQTTETIGDIVELLRGLEVRGNVRDKLIERLQKPRGIPAVRLQSP